MNDVTVDQKTPRFIFSNLDDVSKRVLHEEGELYASGTLGTM